MITHKRVVVYIPEAEYKQLKIALLYEGKTVSGWFREKVSEYLGNVDIQIIHTQPTEE